MKSKNIGFIASSTNEAQEALSELKKIYRIFVFFEEYK